MCLTVMSDSNGDLTGRRDAKSVEVIWHLPGSRVVIHLRTNAVTCYTPHSRRCSPRKRHARQADQVATVKLHILSRCIRRDEMTPLHMHPNADKGYNNPLLPPFCFASIVAREPQCSLAMKDNLYYKSTDIAINSLSLGDLRWATCPN